ncbi:MAG TPA: MATE family efflux transporter [Balneolaceae bacterium]|nr:MATE family efflux transporter [Balneolaceae bacterium]
MNKKILRLAIPNIISNLSVPLLGLIDTALLGHLQHVYYLGALAVGSMIFNFIFWGFGFLRMGTTGLTAQAYGRDDKTDAAMTLSRALLVAAVAGFLIVLAQVLIIDLSMLIVDASPEVEHFTRIYFNIRVFTAPAVLGMYVINGWFLGMQNARYPMIVSVVLNLVNVILDFWFIFGLDMKIAGAAWGTLIARYIGLLLAAFLLIYHYREWLAAYVHKKLWQLDELKKFFLVNRDLFLRTLFLIFAFSFFTAKSATFGNVLLAANTILLQLWLFVSYAVDGFAFAAESLIGRYTGAADKKSVKKTIKYCFIWGFSLGFANALVYAVFSRTILQIFTDQKEVIQAALSFFGWIIAGPVISSFCYIWDGIYIGATATKAMRNSLLIATVAIFLPAYFISEPYIGNHSIWLAMTLFMIARGLMLTLYAPKSIFRKKIV